jgi:aspartate-semialdehyde dehydrogenase
MKIGVVGATGEVGRMMLTCLEEFAIKIDELRLFASRNSAGNKLAYNSQEYTVEELTEESMCEKFDYLLFSAGGTVSKKYAKIAEMAGNTVIDNSSAWRRDPSKPLIIPEINADVINNYSGIIANPNCSTIQMLLALQPIHQINPIKKIVVSTYQSVSGSGNKGIATLKQEEMGKQQDGIYSRKIRNNVIPEIGPYLDNGYTEEEEKMRFETNKIFDSQDILVSATAVRVPVFYGHSESIYVELTNEVDLTQIETRLIEAKSIKYISNDFITPIELVNDNYSYVCRLRKGTDNKSLTFWNVADNIRVGAATNAVRILKYMIDRGQK